MTETGDLYRCLTAPEKIMKSPARKSPAPPRERHLALFCISRASSLYWYNHTTLRTGTPDEEDEPRGGASAVRGLLCLCARGSSIRQYK